MRDLTRRELIAAARKSAVGAAALSAFAPVSARAAVETLRFAYQPGFGYGLYYVAQAKGWLREADVNLEPMTVFTNGPIQIDAVINGEFDAGVLGFVPILTRAAGGQPVRIIDVVVNSGRTYAIVGRQDIDGIPGLAGRTVGVNRGSNYDYFLTRALRKFGVGDRDVRIVNFADPVQAQSAFLARAVDAIVPITTNRNAILEQRPDAKVIFSATQFTEPPNPSPTPFAIYDLLGTTQRALDQHRDALARLMQVFHSRVRDYVTSPATQSDAVDAIYEWQRTVIRAEVTKQQIQANLSAFDYYTVSEARQIVSGGELRTFLEGIAAYLLENRILGRVPDIGTIIDTGPASAMRG
jgi:ABC-type nitrate/sulfonate/bicarbonate transport system substrate-binding protein